MKKKTCLRTIIAMGIMAAFTITAAAEGNRFSSTTSRDENNNICLNFSEVEVLLPADWAGKCRLVTSSDRASFFHIKSQDLFRQEGYDGGLLFDINYSTDLGFQDDPSYLTLGETDEGYYYATFPTDVQAYVDDESARTEYFELYDDMEWVKDHLSLVYLDDYESDSYGEALAQAGSDEEYIFPQSSDEYLTSDDLAGMSYNEIQMAINEIYARHHRKFVLPEVQEYFDSKSWYEGAVEPNDFNPDVMNQCEGANIGLMVKTLNSLSQ